MKNPLKNFRGIWPILFCFTGLFFSFLSIFFVTFKTSWIWAASFFTMLLFLFLYVTKYQKYPWE